MVIPDLVHTLCQRDHRLRWQRSVKYVAADVTEVQFLTDLGEGESRKVLVGKGRIALFPRQPYP
jgi:hypothetical protein